MNYGELPRLPSEKTHTHDTLDGIYEGVITNLSLIQDQTLMAYWAKDLKEVRTFWPTEIEL